MLIKYPSNLISTFFLLSVLLFPACKTVEEKEADRLASSLIPLPIKQEMERGYIVFPMIIRAGQDTSSRMENLTRYLAQTLLERYKLKMHISHFNQDTGISAIHLSVDNGLSTGHEGYIMKVDQDGIAISSQGYAGIFYGIQTLLQLLPSQGIGTKEPGKILIRRMTIEDYPRFSWRGMHLDVSRHFFPKEFIKKYIDILAMHKMNIFHWHLTDDQGWRIQIKKYPKLTEVGAWREDTRDRPWDYRQYPVKPGKPVYGGYYTQDDIREIVQYACERYVTIVPEIEMPGHSWAALYAYPYLSCSGKPFFVSPDVPFEFTDPYCAGKEETFRFLEDVLTEIIELFPSENIHIGGDECKKSPWEKCPKCRVRMQKEGLASGEELQSYFIRRVEKFLLSKGKKLVGWDEILEGGLAPEATVMSWRGEEGGIQAARQGHDAIMTPAEVLYFSRKQDEEPMLAEEDGFYALRNVYLYDPQPSILSESEAKHILGAQGCLWTEETQTPAIAEYKILPRLCALAEITWTAKERKNYANFLARLFYHYGRLDFLGANYYVPVPGGFGNQSFLGSSTTVTIKVPSGGYLVRYTINGKIPDSTSAIYRQPFQVRNYDTLRAAVFLPSGKHSRVRTAVFRSLALKQPAHVVPGKPGIAVTAFSGDIVTLDSFKTLRKGASFILDSISIPEIAAKDTFGLQFDGFIKIAEDGLYTFYLASDDGSCLWVADSLIVNADGIHGPSEESGTIGLAKGYHPLRLQYFERFHGESLILKFSGPGIRKKLVPKEILWHE